MAMVTPPGHSAADHSPWAVGTEVPEEPAVKPLGRGPALPPRGLSLGSLGARFAIVGVWIALTALYWILKPDTFGTTGTFQTIFNSQQALVFLTAALLCTICVGEFVDMSVASIFGIAAVIPPVLYTDHGWNVWVAAIVAVLLAAVCGAVNGILIVYVGVNTIVVTLGMGTLLLGIALWMTNLMPASGLPESITRIALPQFLGLPVSFWEGLVLMLAFGYMLQFTPMGRNIRFVGSNREVSRLAGIQVNRLRFGAFTVAGLIAGIGGVISSAAIGGFDSTVSQTYILPTFAATFLGTAILQPGRFSPVGTLIAVYFLATGILGLQLLGAAAWVSDVFYGAVLVIAVTISTLLHARTR